MSGAVVVSASPAVCHVCFLTDSSASARGVEEVTASLTHLLRPAHDGKGGWAFHPVEVRVEVREREGGEGSGQTISAQYDGKQSTHNNNSNNPVEDDEAAIEFFSE